MRLWFDTAVADIQPSMHRQALCSPLRRSTPRIPRRSRFHGAAPWPPTSILEPDKDSHAPIPGASAVDRARAGAPARCIRVDSRRSSGPGVHFCHPGHHRAATYRAPADQIRMTFWRLPPDARVTKQVPAAAIIKLSAGRAIDGARLPLRPNRRRVSARPCRGCSGPCIGISGAPDNLTGMHARLGRLTGDLNPRGGGSVMYKHGRRRRRACSRFRRFRGRFRLQGSEFLQLRPILGAAERRPQGAGARRTPRRSVSGEPRATQGGRPAYHHAGSAGNVWAMSTAFALSRKAGCRECARRSRDPQARPEETAFAGPDGRYFVRMCRDCWRPRGLGTYRQRDQPSYAGWVGAPGSWYVFLREARGGTLNTGRSGGGGEAQP